MMPSVIHAYIQVGHFLMLIMSTSWAYSTFFFLALCAVLGPQGHFGDIIRCWGSNHKRIAPHQSPKDGTIVLEGLNDSDEANQKRDVS